MLVVPRAGIEPARGYPRGILSPLRLPIPPPRQPYFSMVYTVLLGSKLHSSITFFYNSVCVLHSSFMPYWMNYANLEGLQNKQNTKNTRGIMRYQLRIFQLILLVFSNGSASGLKEDYVVTGILKKRKLNKKQ